MSAPVDEPAHAGAVGVVFSEVKRGNPAWEWEDCASLAEAYRPGHPRGIVVDGATEAYDAVRWVRLLVTSFLDHADAPGAITADELEPWFARVQARWVAEAPSTFGSIFEARKFARMGSFATLLCFDVVPAPRGGLAWQAASLGDTVLFHVRDEELIDSYPTIEDFGNQPDGVYTAPSALPQMMAELRPRTGAHRIEPGDTLFVATDALAAWILARREVEAAEALWRTLGRLRDGDTFTELVGDLRDSGELKNDDTTLLRLEFPHVSTPSRQGNDDDCH